MPRSDRNDDEQRQIEWVRTAKDRAARSLRRYPNVIGVGVGYKNVRDQATPIVCVRVYVKKKVPERELAPSDVVPKKVNGVPTDVIEDTFTTHAVLPGSEHRRRRAILNAGISIGNAITGGSGTLGACVFDAHSGAQLLLSNWHVLCGRTSCNPGEAIIQPGTGGGDGGRVGDIVARLSRASLSDVVDAGVAVITGHRLFFEEVLGLGRLTGTAAAVLGEGVSKSGRTTGVTSATVTDVDADVDVGGYPNGEHSFRHQLVIEGENASLPGDSGSGWMNVRKQLVGLNFAGGNSGRRAIANPIADVVDALAIVVTPGVPLHDHLRVAIV